MSNSWTSKSLLLEIPIESGFPTSSNFKIVESVVHESELVEDGVIVQLLCISADPYLRGMISSTNPNAFKAGQVMAGFVSGKIIASKNSDWKVGDLIGTRLPFSTVQVLNKELLAPSVSRNLTGIIPEENISYGIGILGMPGATAYGGLIDVLKPKAGEVLFISAASGAVGGLVGMIAKQFYGCTVIGSCGSDEKCNIAKKFFGFDHCINYKNANNTDELVALIKQYAPDGIDMYFENVGGMHYEAAKILLKVFGRIAVCGVISEYNKGGKVELSFSPMEIIYKRLRIEGFLSSDWLSGSRGNFLVDMQNWLREGKVKPLECFFDGIEQWPVAFASLFSGENVGKVVVRV
jgi:NADPH-dependent curcumin reductase CurA